MTIAQTYYLAHTARKKLTTQAARADHDLRLLVGHANLLDSLMLELSDAEQEKERWFNQSVHGATKASPVESTTVSTTRRVQWAEDPVIEEPEDDWDLEDISDADSDVSDEDDDDIVVNDDGEYSDYVVENFLVNCTRLTPMQRQYNKQQQEEEQLQQQQQQQQQRQQQRAPSPVAVVTEHEVDEGDETDSDFEEAAHQEDEEGQETGEPDDNLEDLESLSLTRSPSRPHCPHCPPDLASDSDEESEEEALPPTPPQLTFDAFESGQSTDIKEPTPPPDSKQPGIFGQRYYVPRREQSAVVEAF